MVVILVTHHTIILLFDSYYRICWGVSHPPPKCSLGGLLGDNLKKMVIDLQQIGLFKNSLKFMDKGCLLNINIIFFFLNVIQNGWSVDPFCTKFGVKYLFVNLLFSYCLKSYPCIQACLFESEYWLSLSVGYYSTWLWIRTCHSILYGNYTGLHMDRSKSCLKTAVVATCRHRIQPPTWFS